ncbi:hypothetical protein FRB99_001960, partial [Tulasnella sp. 403]
MKVKDLPSDRCKLLWLGHSRGQAVVEDGDEVQVNDVKKTLPLVHVLGALFGIM